MTIFGYTWDEIKRAQQGGALARRIPAGLCKPLATKNDWELLERYGEAELRNRGYFGVLDRLENTRLANDTQDRPTKACGVEYLPRQAGAGLPPTLTYADTQQRFTYTYENDADQVGRVTEDE